LKEEGPFGSVSRETRGNDGLKFKNGGLGRRVLQWDGGYTFLDTSLVFSILHASLKGDTFQAE
jgi:hypothetical protein